MGDKLQQIGHLAFREEGENWNAYYALTDTMDGALLLGSIRMAIIIDHPNRRATFMGLMREAVADIIEEKAGVRPTWKEPKAAPFWEKRP